MGRQAEVGFQKAKKEEAGEEEKDQEEDDNIRRRNCAGPLAGWLPERGELEHVVGALHANAFRVLSTGGAWESQSRERLGVRA